MHNNQSP